MSSLVHHFIFRVSSATPLPPSLHQILGHFRRYPQFLRPSSDIGPKKILPRRNNKIRKKYSCIFVPVCKMRFGQVENIVQPFRFEFIDGSEVLDCICECCFGWSGKKCGGRLALEPKKIGQLNGNYLTS
jgi:hypothetical protein